MRLKYTFELLAPVVKESYSYAEVARKLGLSPHGGGHHYIKIKVGKLGICVAHFCREKWAKSTSVCNGKKDASWYLVDKTLEKKREQSARLRRSLLEIGREYKCGKCGIEKWCNKAIVLQIHHIDGNSYDHRAKNLMFLCPNCHTQTPNYAGAGSARIEKKYCLRCETQLYQKNKSGYCIECYWLKRKENSSSKTFVKASRIKKKESNKTCLDCKTPISDRATRCKKCSSIATNADKMRFTITKEKLEKLVWEISTSKIAKQYNVSDKTIEKRCKKFGISKPPRGYWAKIYQKMPS